MKIDLIVLTFFMMCFMMVGSSLSFCTVHSQY